MRDEIRNSTLDAIEGEAWSAWWVHEHTYEHRSVWIVKFHNGRNWKAIVVFPLGEPTILSRTGVQVEFVSASSAMQELDKHFSHWGFFRKEDWTLERQPTASRMPLPEALIGPYAGFRPSGVVPTRKREQGP